ncbi:MAG: prepilin-type N-terminal cleavage/methylation domain-containing protein [Rhodocyclales bacterium]|nr:prepilin-type N-terminal cleavage/methylation domain-containing protein [Rhodocyclales bacterium]
MKRTRGFTLIELVVVIMITGIMAASIAVFFVPAINAYFDTRRRAEMTDTADTALRRMARDVRRAVPNSIRIVGDQCFELVPTKAGGLYRRAADIVNAGVDPLDITQPDISFDVLSPMNGVFGNDFVVIGNQNGNDVYDGTNRGIIATWATPNPAGAAVGTGRITLGAATQFPAGYDGGRFQVVDAIEQSVFYICSGTGVAGGNGTGQLRRLVRAFTAAVPAVCPVGGELLASTVEACTFTYNPATSATQAAGFVSMQIDLTAGGETMGLSHGTHVSNVP